MATSRASAYAFTSRKTSMLLVNAGVSPPYVLVGHALGGLHIRVYQNLYPSDVAGMVLVHSEHPDRENRLPPEMKKIQSRLFEVEALGFPLM
jgi:pimeloyl-ACP methyl ester carboxylesterase